MTDEAVTEAVALGPVSGAGRGRKPVRHPYRNGSATTHKPGHPLPAGAGVARWERTPPVLARPRGTDAATQVRVRGWTPNGWRRCQGNAAGRPLPATSPLHYARLSCHPLPRSYGID